MLKGMVCPEFLIQEPFGVVQQNNRKLRDLPTKMVFMTSGVSANLRSES
jgi:hypothetical protein